LFSVEDQGDWDLWVLDLATSEARPWLAGPFRVEDPRFSPDGRWVAYASNESGTFQINVRNFPEGDRRHVVSVGGDTAPTWSADGRELFYYSASSEIVAVPVSGLSSEPRFGEGKPLFRVRLRRPGREFEIFPDGGSFLLNRIVEPERGVPLTLVVGWDRAGAGR
jgi:dipeptidyl aminopeptidase/acylaminoacyl peptidase